jgi:hypothetical protein
MKSHILVIVCTISVLALRQANGAIIVNGDFENPDVTFQYYPDGPGPSPWTVGTAMYLVDSSSSNGGPNDVAESGSQYMEYAGNGRGNSQLSQVLNGLTVGGLYTVSYYVSASAFRTFSQTVYGAFGITGTLGGGSNTYTSSLPDPGEDNTIDVGTVDSPWVHRSFQFTASTGTDTLMFTFTGHSSSPGSGSYPAIDSVTLTAIPEPSVVFLSVMGVVALSLRRARVSS